MINTAKDALENLIKKMPGIKNKIKGYEAVEAWEREIDKHSWAYNFSGGTLFVATENPSLAQELSFGKKNLIERINSVIGAPAVNDIKVKVSTREQKN